MIEQAMFFTLGFSVAGLFALLILPAISRRASRLARADVERQMPLSAHEIVAQRDLLRAEFATERRRLEQALEGSAEAHAQERAESGRRVVEAKRLADGLAETVLARDAAQSTRDAAERRMRETEGENAAFAKALYDADGVETRLRESVALLGGDKADLERAGAAARAAIAALEGERAQAGERIGELERALMQSRLDLSLARTQVETQGAQIDGHAERVRAAAAREAELRQRIAELERAGANGDLDMLRRTIVEIGREVVRLAQKRPERDDVAPLSSAEVE